MATLESPAAVSLVEAPAAAGHRPAVEVAHLRKTYGTLVAVDDVSFTVAEGEIFGILGPNGAGKTTAIECAIGCAGRLTWRLMMPSLHIYRPVYMEV